MILWNESRRPLAGVRAPESVIEFHKRFPNYTATPMVRVPSLAALLRVGEVWVKDESRRLGLPSFKMLGASWAIYRALSERLGHPLSQWESISELALQFEVLKPLTLVTATDGNHGRAVARMARLLGVGADVFVPSRTSEERIDAMKQEGAHVEVVPGTYDDAIAYARKATGGRKMMVSDTSWPGYERFPHWIVEGYSTIFREVDEQLRAEDSGERDALPDLVFVQMGVGAFAASAVAHFRQDTRGSAVRIVGVEPSVAACVAESIAQGRRITISGSQDSIMAGLNCGTPSLVAWPMLQAGMDVFVTVEDDRAVEAVRLLAESGIESGESGAAGLAGALELLRGRDWEQNRIRLRLPSQPSVLLISTEGATDRGSYNRIVGAPR